MTQKRHELALRNCRSDTPDVANDSWPFRRSDALFVVAVVLVALPAPGNGWSLTIPPPMKIGLVVAVVAAWIRFRVFGRGD